MANVNERAELHKTIWKIANDLRGSVDGWEFKAYVLGAIFYRYISENITNYLNKLQRQSGDTEFDYAKLNDEEAEDARDMVVEEKGYFILPSQLFCNVVKECKAGKIDKLNKRLSNIFKAIEGSAQGQPSEQDLKGLFSDFTVESNSLGKTVSKRNELLSKVLTSVNMMTLGEDLEGNSIDAFGDAYEFLMQMYAANAGKSGGEFFTPQAVSELLAMLASLNNNNIRSVYDPCCGSGSLLLKFAKTVGKKNPNLMYYGQEINPSTYNLCRINMFLHGINFSNFDIALGDTLKYPQHRDLEPFDAIVSNPPYSITWAGEDDTVLAGDDRFTPAGVLAPKSKADLAFTMHMLKSLSETGTAAIVEFPGVLYRGGAERIIRKYLIYNNYIDTIIQLPANLFFGVGISTCIIVLKKSAKRDNSVLFIDASNMYKKEGNKNFLLNEHQGRILSLYAERVDVQYLSRLVRNSEILDNDCNLSVNNYVEQEEKHEIIEIDELNMQLKDLIEKGYELNQKIESIIEDLEA
jgi:type I restriction enzyme M protein